MTAAAGAMELLQWMRVYAARPLAAIDRRFCAGFDFGDVVSSMIPQRTCDIGALR